MRLGRTATVHFVGQVVVSVAGFVATFLIARLLGAGPLGEYAIAVGLLFWFSIPLNGIGGAITKRVSEGTNTGSRFTAGFLSNVGIAAGIAAVVVLFRDELNAYIGAPVGSLVGLLVVANALFISVRCGLEGEQRVAEAGLFKAAERVFRTGGQVVFIVLGWHVAGLVIGHVLSLLIVVVAGLAVSNLSVRLPTRKDFHDLYTYGRYSWMGTLESRVFGWMDTLVLALFVSSTFIGIYEVAWTLSSFLGIASASIRTTLFPKLSELSTEDREDRVLHFLEEGLAFTGVLTIPGLFGVAVIGPRVLGVYGTEFTQGGRILLLLIVAQIFNVYKSPLTSVINAIDRPDVTFRINVQFIVTNVTLNVVLIWQYGWYGAAAATVLSSGLALFLGYRAVYSLLDRPPFPVSEIGIQTLAAAAMAVLLVVVDEYAPSNAVGTVSLVLFGAAVYGTLLWTFSGRFREKVGLVLPDTALP
ncbi:flippase [Halostella salina]|uniref:flippase n=1 Tax=Halostella salina TaxID=1547897 RepID=UPI000EF7C132|nr:flippase [Halostella salina]